MLGIAQAATMQQPQATSTATSSGPHFDGPQLPGDIIIRCAHILAAEGAAHVQDLKKKKRCDSVRDLCSCTQVCTMWRDNCRPILWRNLALILQYSWTPPWPQHPRSGELAKLFWVNGRPPSQQVQRRAKTIHDVIEFFKDRPDLAQYVRALALVAGLQSGTILPGYIRLDPVVLLELLRYLPLLRDLHLKDIKLEFDAARASLSFPKLRQLSYSFVETFTRGPLRGTEDLLVPLRLFTDLDQLCLSRKFWALPRSRMRVDPRAALVKLGPVQCRVRSVAVDVETPWLSQLLKGLRRDLDPSCVRTLELGVVSQDHLAFEGLRLLRKSARSLRRLSIKFSVPTLTGAHLAELIATVQGTILAARDHGNDNLHDELGDSGAEDEDGDDGDEDEFVALPGAEDFGVIDGGHHGDGNLQSNIFSRVFKMPSLEHLSLCLVDDLPPASAMRGPLLFTMVVSLLMDLVPVSPALRHVHIITRDCNSIFTFMARLPADDFHGEIEQELCKGHRFELWTFEDAALIESDGARPLDPDTIVRMQAAWPELHSRGVLRFWGSSSGSDTGRPRAECEEMMRDEI